MITKSTEDNQVDLAGSERFIKAAFQRGNVGEMQCMLQAAEDPEMHPNVKIMIWTCRLEVLNRLLSLINGGVDKGTLKISAAELKEEIRRVTRKLHRAGAPGFSNRELYGKKIRPENHTEESLLMAVTGM